jgi:hypothetical protein
MFQIHRIQIKNQDLLYEYSISKKNIRNELVKFSGLRKNIQNNSMNSVD